jgi:glycosyltransferase 2 family protein
VSRRRAIRIAVSLLVTGLALWYILARTDLGEAAHVLGSANLGYAAAAFALMAVTVVPMAWRWQLLLRARGIDDSLVWLTRAYLTSYTAGQILPTAVGGDALRIYETSRRHPGESGPVAGAVLLERLLGAAATLVLAAVGFLLAVGRYEVGAYLWVEASFVVATVVLGVLLFAGSARPLLRRTVPLARRLRLERPLRAVYEGIHVYRSRPRLLLAVTALTLATQALRILPIWLAGKAVGVDLSPRPYYVLGPLLFLVLLVPFTVNGLAVRESFFVSFMSRLGVSSELALATGFLFFLVNVALSLPGAVILGWESIRGRRWIASRSSS